MTSPEPTAASCQCDAELRRRLDDWRAYQDDVTAAVRETLGISPDDILACPPEALAPLPAFIRNLARDRDQWKAAASELTRQRDEAASANGATKDALDRFGTRSGR